MKDGLVRWILAAAVVAAILLPQGCKRHAAPAPAQPIVRSIPKVAQPDIPGPLPVENTDQGVSQRRSQPRRHAPASQVQSQPTDAAGAASTAVAQRRQDAKLLQQQEAASQAQQQELNQEVQRDRKMQEQMQDEPRIQDAPEPPGSSGLGPDAPRIQDAPGPAQGQPGQEPPRIQDAPGPAQTPPPPAQPQT